MAIAIGSGSEPDDGGSETATEGELEAEGDAEALESAEVASTSSDGLAVGLADGLAVGLADGDDWMVGECDGARVGTGVGLGTALKVASMTVAAVGVKAHVADLPEHGPFDQPPKTEPRAALAVSVTGCPEAKGT
jgi:hypothetical protein